MTILQNPDLLDVLACPVCNHDLTEDEGDLKCVSCSAVYAVRDGIPLLYPPHMDRDHLMVEENLAHKMIQPKVSSREQFNSRQWDDSKREFWGMVQDTVQGSTGSFINIGCGYDHHFSGFEESGSIFVNFDLVFTMLDTLQNDYNAKSCVAGDIHALPFRKKAFDYVVSIDVIHHESDHLQPILESFRDLLKPGGILFLEDPNAWGMFQMAKSIFLPRPLYRALRSAYHSLKQSTHKPADYEFPTSVWRVKRILRTLGFEDITIFPNNAYPCISEQRFRLYEFCTSDYVKKYHNYHYMLRARRR